jgi:NTE family protein
MTHRHRQDSCLRTYLVPQSNDQGPGTTHFPQDDPLRRVREAGAAFPVRRRQPVAQLLATLVRHARKLRAFVVIAALLLGACASLSVPMNEPLRSGGNTEYRLLDVNRRGGAESVLVLVALSGGGKRSATFGFGMLRGLQDIHVRPEGKDSTLLNEIDMLAGVSGGAFPTAHFGLYGETSFETFPGEFLYADIEDYIWGTFLPPWNWDWLFNPLVGTNDRMIRVYGRLMFHGATYADLFRRGRPQVSVNATDISFGSPFGFLPQTFDMICSDLASLPIASAVAASNRRADRRLQHRDPDRRRCHGRRPRPQVA